MPPALSLCVLEGTTSVVASKVSFCAKHRAGPWKIKKQTGHSGGLIAAVGWAESGAASV